MAATKVEMWPTEFTKRDGSRPVLWFFHRRARNGKITDASQGYSTKSNCRRAIRNRWPDATITTLDKRP